MERRITTRWTVCLDKYILQQTEKKGSIGPCTETRFLSTILDIIHIQLRLTTDSSVFFDDFSLEVAARNLKPRCPFLHKATQAYGLQEGQEGFLLVSLQPFSGTTPWSLCLPLSTGRRYQTAIMRFHCDVEWSCPTSTASNSNHHQILPDRKATGLNS